MRTLIREVLSRGRTVSQSTPGGSAWSLLIVLAACAVVAIGASASSLTSVPAELSDAQLQRFRLSGLAAALVGLAALWLLRRPTHAHSKQGAGRTSSALSRAAVIMLVLGWLALLGPRPDVPPTSDPSGGRPVPNPDAQPSAIPPPPSMRSSELPRLDGTAEDEATEFQPAVDQLESEEPNAAASEEPLFSVESLLGLLLVLAILGLGATFLRRRGPRMASPENEEDLAEARAEAAAGLEASLANVHFDAGDPRGQITLAYQQLLAALEDAGGPRRPYQAPHEHLYQVLGPLGVAPEPLHELTRLYVLAQFSERPVTEGHRGRAVAALERSLADLRDAVALSRPRSAEWVA